MTCIVGFADKGKVYIGGDSAGISGMNIIIRADSKVFHNGDFIFGFTSSFRMGQIIRYNFVPPTRVIGVSDEQYLYGDFLNALAKAMTSKGYAKIENNQIEGGVFLMGYRGKLYYVGSDFQIGSSLKNYDSVGCGSNYALGAMFALEQYELRSEEQNKYLMLPKERIEMALIAAETFSTGVSRPFVVVNN